MRFGHDRRWMLPTMFASLAIVLTSCMPSGPTQLETPAIVWDPAAPVMDDPYAEAASEYVLGWVLAQNSADFTIEQLTSRATDRRIEDIYDQFVSAYVNVDSEPRTYVGPLPHTVIDVTETAGGAEVRVCYASAKWYVEIGHPEPSVDLTVDGTTTTLVMVTTPEGELKVDEVRSTNSACDVSDIAVGTFDPQPAIRETISERDIRKPLFLDQY
jgi:hypothetical protein